MMWAHTKCGVVLRDHHLRVLGRERLAEQRAHLELDLLLVVDELVEPLRGARGGLGEVLVLGVVTEVRDAFEDLVVALGEEGECLGIELHGVSSYVRRIAAVEAAMPSAVASAIATRRMAS